MQVVMERSTDMLIFLWFFWMQHWMKCMFLLIFKLDTLHLACVATKACASTRATSFHKILALWALSLCHYSGQHAVAIGSPSHGRPKSFQNVEVNVGCFTDFLVYSLQLEGTPFSFLQQVCDVVAEADANSLLPFGEISRGSLGDKSRHPIFQAMLTWQPKGGWEKFGHLGSWKKKTSLVDFFDGV